MYAFLQINSAVHEVFDRLFPPFLCMWECTVTYEMQYLEELLFLNSSLIGDKITPPWDYAMGQLMW